MDLGITQINGRMAEVRRKPNSCSKILIRIIFRRMEEVLEGNQFEFRGNKNTSEAIIIPNFVIEELIFQTLDPFCGSCG